MKPAGPLARLGVVVTRDEPAGGALAALLTAAGARVLHWPAMAILPPADPAPLAREVAALEGYDWLVLTSAHAVEALAESRAVLPSTLRIAVVGGSTGAAVRERGWRVDRQPVDFSSEALLRCFAADARGARILFPASDRAAATLPAGLEALGAEVVRVDAYRTASAALDAAGCLGAAARGEVDLVTFASPSAVEGLAQALGEAALAHLLVHAAVAVIGPATAGALLRRGRIPDAIASPATLDGLVTAAAAAHRRFSERKLPCRS